MVDLSNITETGDLLRGSYLFEICDEEAQIYFTFKMIKGGFLIGYINIEDTEKFIQADNSDLYTTRLIIVDDLKEKGKISYISNEKIETFSFDVDFILLDRTTQKKDYDIYTK